MKSIEITLSDIGDFEKLNALLAQLNLDKNIKIREKRAHIDPVTMLSQDSLAEEWDSDEDKRWDNLL